MRIAFLGTPDFALPSLRMLCESSQELFVVSQPDKAQGRGHRFCSPSVICCARDKGINTLQTDCISKGEAFQKLQDFQPDLMITAAFGQILTQEVLDIPKLGCINVHASLLPKYRGASPIQTAIINGETVTGITTMMTDIGLDTGDILLQKVIEIHPNETAGELTERLAVLGSEVLKDTITALENGTLKRIPQDHSKATKCRTISKSKAKIDFSKSAKQLHDFVRGMNPSPCAFAFLNENTVKIFKTIPHSEMKSGERPGTAIIASPKQGLFVSTGEGVLEIVEMQYPNSRCMEAKCVLNSKRLLGEVFS
ncbi:MAG: methionyl-tRNA formyltransferase [Clostridiales bacterium]|nr:methionyl-tRNA formyltransferase [Clostridiales bacterium]